MISLSEYINESIINEGILDKIKKTYDKIENADSKDMSYDEFVKEFQTFIKDKMSDNVKIDGKKFIFSNGSVERVEISQAVDSSRDEKLENFYCTVYDKSLDNGSGGLSFDKEKNGNKCNTLNLDKLKLAFQGLAKAKGFMSKAFDKIKSLKKSKDNDDKDSGSGGFDSTAAAAGAIYRMTMDY